jgi:NADPH:quinone reductase-like Zn-dependent oxidoreductase
MNGLTVRLALDQLKLSPGDTLLVTGAAGAVGGYAIELGVAEGLVVLAVGAPSDETLLVGLGATEVFERGEALVARVRERYPDGVDAVIDAALLHASVLGAIRDGGKLVAVRPFAGEPERNITILQARVSEYAHNQAALDSLRELAETGDLTPRVAATYPPERAGEAELRLAAGGVRGRLVIVF